MIPRIEFPELFFGFVAPIGTAIQPSIDALTAKLLQLDYNVCVIKVTDVFEILEKRVKPVPDLVHSQTIERYETHIEYGDLLRAKTDNDAIFAQLTTMRIAQVREKNRKEPIKNAYILHKFKRKEEIK